MRFWILYIRYWTIKKINRLRLPRKYLWIECKFNKHKYSVGLENVNGDLFINCNCCPKKIKTKRSELDKYKLHGLVIKGDFGFTIKTKLGDILKKHYSDKYYYHKIYML